MSKLSNFRNLTAAILLAASPLALAACDDGEPEVSLENAAEETGNALENAGDNVGEAADEAGDELEGGLENTEERAD